MSNDQDAKKIRHLYLQVCLQSWRRQVYLLQVLHLFLWVFYFIYNRWVIYKSTSCLIDRWQAIYKCLLSFDLHMHGVTSFKHGSLILPTVLKTLGDIFVYALP